MDNYNKEKVITTNKVTPIGINGTAKMPLLKLFLYFTITDKCLLIKWIYIYTYERETSVSMCYTITVKQKTRLFDEFSYSFNT